MPAKLFDDVWTTNARGVFLSMKHELPVMLRNEQWGRMGMLTGPFGPLKPRG